MVAGPQPASGTPSPPATPTRLPMPVHRVLLKGPDGFALRWNRRTPQRRTGASARRPGPAGHVLRACENAPMPCLLLGRGPARHLETVVRAQRLALVRPDWSLIWGPRHCHPSSSVSPRLLRRVNPGVARLQVSWLADWISPSRPRAHAPNLVSEHLPGDSWAGRGWRTHSRAGYAGPWGEAGTPAGHLTSPNPTGITSAGV